MGAGEAVQSAGEHSGRIKEPVIVVSDVHLGGKESNVTDFRDFLQWLSTLPLDGKIYDSNGSKITINRPGTLILLGDILELWDPEDDDRNNVLTDVLAPLITLNSLGCDIIYVLGNHDEDLLDFKSVWRAWRKKNGEFLAKGSFDIKYRSYPRPGSAGVIKGEPIGQRTYAFLHGQQFDRLQVFYRLSKFLSEKMDRQIRIDPIDWCQDLANVSFTRNVGKRVWNTSIILVLILYGIWYTYWLEDLGIGGFWGGVVIAFLRIIWWVAVFVIAVTVPPKVIAFANTEIWRRIPGIAVKKCKSVEEVINERYVDEKGNYIDADVIVFGHTHFQGYYVKEVQEVKEVKAKRRWFINSGAWVKISEECKRKGAVQNTFLYIDAAAPHLLQWNNAKVANGELPCVEDVSEVLRT